MVKENTAQKHVLLNGIAQQFTTHDNTLHQTLAVRIEATYSAILAHLGRKSCISVLC